MTDQVRKTAIIHDIEALLLPCNLISALDDAKQAEAVATAVEQLRVREQTWY